MSAKKAKFQNTAQSAIPRNSSWPTAKRAPWRMAATSGGLLVGRRGRAVPSLFATTAAAAQASAAAAKPIAGVNPSAKTPAAIGATRVIAARASSMRAF